uniref:Receptor protein-tyrosine kinase n=1 Tax=Rhabditophanes sp. KR3021 TaxID=114890 RepID=A0AC35U544_9BILA
MVRDEDTHPKNIPADRWVLLTTISLYTQKQTVGRDKRSVVVVDYVPVSDAVMFAIKEKDACMVVYRLQVYFNVCPGTTINQIQLPETIVSADEYVPTYFHAHCVKNAVDVSNANTDRNVFCQGNGQWKIGEKSRCQCNAGYTASDEGACSACPKGSYKSDTGNEVCKPCPRNSKSHENGSKICECENDFYRADNEDHTNICSQPPSAPLNLKVISLHQSEAVLTWAKPTYLGHRSDIYYSVTCELCNDNGKDCTKCPSTVIFNFNSERIVTHEISMSKLEPGKQYVATVFANNAVSKKEMNPKNSMRIAFVTKKANGYKISAPTLLTHENNGTLVIAWLAADNISKYHNVYYQVELKNSKEVILHDSSQNAMKIDNVDVYESHAIRVRVNDARDGWSEWSDALVVKNKYSKAESAVKNVQDVVVSEDGQEKVEKDSYLYRYVYLENPKLVYIFGCVMLLIFVVCVMCYFCPRRSKKGDYFAELVKSQNQELPYNFGIPSSGFRESNNCLESFKGSSTFIDGNTNKNYIDPSTYGDLTVAMREFTRQIPKANIFMTNEMLGEGEFGNVEKGIILLNGNLKTASVAEGTEVTVACKTLKKVATEMEKKLFTMEATTMGQFQHDNVLRLLGVVGTDYVEIIITEFMVNGSLINYLKLNSINTCSKVQLTQICLDISEGMQYLHKTGYIHRDLASRNILLDQFYRCKISDFGLSRNGFAEGSDEMEYTNAMAKKIPIRWTAPEALEKGTYTAASDIWSYGVVMWEIFSFGERPYYDWPHRKIYEEVLQGYRLPKSMDCPEAIYQIMTQCWNKEKGERPTFFTITPKLRAYIRIYEESLDYAVNSPLYQTPTEATYEVARDDNCNNGNSRNGFYQPPPNHSEAPTGTTRNTKSSKWEIAESPKDQLERLSEMDLTLTEQKQLAVAIDSIVTSRRPQTGNKARKNPYHADQSFRGSSMNIKAFSSSLKKEPTDGGFLV